MTDWAPIDINARDQGDVLLLVFSKDDEREIEIFRCRCGEHGAYFFQDGGMLSVNESGWIPFAWRKDDLPARDDTKFPPMWTDYLTRPMDD